MTTQNPNKPKRKTYSPEFKAYLVKEVESSGRSIVSIARDHGINQNLLHNWKRQHQSNKSQISKLPAAPQSATDANPCFIPITIEPEATRLCPSPSVIQNIRLQTPTQRSGPITLNIDQIDLQSLIELLRGLQ